jgi:hypothetical protein
VIVQIESTTERYSTASTTSLHAIDRVMRFASRAIRVTRHQVTGFSSYVAAYHREVEVAHPIGLSALPCGYQTPGEWKFHVYAMGFRI